MAKRTTINPAHPWNQYKKQREELKHKIKSYSNEQLDSTFERELPDLHADLPHLARHKKVKELLDLFGRGWRKAWLEEFGWEFDEVKDGEKFKARIDAGEFIKKSNKEDNAESKKESGN